MNFLTKKCEICEIELNKLQSLWNIYALKTGAKLKCPKCNTEYKTYKIISFFGGVYSFFGPLIAIFFIVRFIDSFHFSLGLEVWVYAWIVYSILEFILMIFLPLRKIEEKIKEVENGTN
ncbi:hypothetical protein CRU99_13740 [Malaciobacter mytili]|uniref:hypothetical protein n=1 Tax=Malaciobacter mytili TaxID=603050 RepID=UPI00100AD8E2|nr:hypothetical protein [Malaciobacter mytili]RXI35850.1 hypothetical protein CRU99_13740 [Malaciobacter mytili]